MICIDPALSSNIPSELYVILSITELALPIAIPDPNKSTFGMRDTYKVFEEGQFQRVLEEILN